MDSVLHRQAERWLAAMQALWGTDMAEWHPDDCGWRVQRLADAGYDAWAQGSREELIYAAANRLGPDRLAFATLALQHWTDDFLMDENFWLLPYQLAWAYGGVQLKALTGLPDGVSIADLPLTAKDKVEKREAAPGERDGLDNSTVGVRREVQA